MRAKNRVRNDIINERLARIHHIAGPMPWMRTWIPERMMLMVLSRERRAKTEVHVAEHLQAAHWPLGEFEGEALDRLNNTLEGVGSALDGATGVLPSVDELRARIQGKHRLWFVEWPLDGWVGPDPVGSFAWQFSDLVRAP